MQEKAQPSSHSTSAHLSPSGRVRICIALCLVGAGKVVCGTTLLISAEQTKGRAPFQEIRVQANKYELRWCACKEQFDPLGRRGKRGALLTDRYCRACYSEAQMETYRWRLLGSVRTMPWAIWVLACPLVFTALTPGLLPQQCAVLQLKASFLSRVTTCIDLFLCLLVLAFGIDWGTFRSLCDFGHAFDEARRVEVPMPEQSFADLCAYALQETHIGVAAIVAVTLDLGALLTLSYRSLMLEIRHAEMKRPDMPSRLASLTASARPVGIFDGRVNSGIAGEAEGYPTGCPEPSNRTQQTLAKVVGRTWQSVRGARSTGQGKIPCDSMSVAAARVLRLGLDLDTQSHLSGSTSDDEFDLDDDRSLLSMRSNSHDTHPSSTYRQGRQRALRSLAASTASIYPLDLGKGHHGEVPASSASGQHRQSKRNLVSGTAFSSIGSSNSHSVRTDARRKKQAPGSSSGKHGPLQCARPCGASSDGFSEFFAKPAVPSTSVDHKKKNQNKLGTDTVSCDRSEHSRRSRKQCHHSMQDSSCEKMMGGPNAGSANLMGYAQNVANRSTERVSQAGHYENSFSDASCASVDSFSNLEPSLLEELFHQPLPDSTIAIRL